MSKLDYMLEPKTSVHRVEVITGTGRRRHFSADDKARFIEEALAPGAVVSEVARRHGLSPQQLFTWRRLIRQPAARPAPSVSPMFVPALVTTSSAPLEHSPRRRRRGCRTAKIVKSGSMIELEIDGVAVLICRHPVDLWYAWDPAAAQDRRGDWIRA